MRLAMEKDLETVRQAALLLEAKNRKLVAKNLELQTECIRFTEPCSEGARRAALSGYPLHGSVKRIPGKTALRKVNHGRMVWRQDKQ